MGTIVIEGTLLPTGTTDKHVISRASSYATARDGGGDIYLSGSGDLVRFNASGQHYSGGLYYVHQCGLSFDLTGIDDRVLINAAVISLCPSTMMDTGSKSPGFQIRQYDYGYSYGYTDFVPGVDLSSYTLMASAAWGDLTEDVDSAFTSAAALLALLEDADARPDEFRLIVVPTRQVYPGYAPTGIEAVEWNNSLHPPILTLTYSGYAISCTAQQGSTASAMAGARSALVTQGSIASCTRLSTAPQSDSDLLRIYNHARVGQGILLGTARVTRKLDGSDTIQATVPYEYRKGDGTTMTWNDMLTSGWYLLYRGTWYRMEQVARDALSNKLTLYGTSCEVELEKYLTNYSQVPLVMPAHTPSEIMEAVLSGEPQMRWYNGDFATLDDAGFPVGWIPDDTENWTAYGSAGGPGVSAVSFPNGEAILESYPIPHTVGASIKPVIDVWTDAAFAGSISLILAYVDDFGTETATTTIAMPFDPGAWSTFTHTAFVPICNQRVKMRLRIYDNDAMAEVRFRNARFIQDEDTTGWTYQGEYDTRATAVAYNDPRWLRYGTWTENVGGYIYPSGVSDVLALPFTGDSITVNFAAGGNTAVIRMDGAVKVSGLAVSSATSYTITDLDRFRPHLLEVQADSGVVRVSSATLTSENRISVSWNRLDVYSALRELRAITGGEFWYDTTNRIIHHVVARGDDLTAANILWLWEGGNLPDFQVTEEMSEIENRLYYGGYGDGAFQIGAKLDSKDTVGGSTSQTLYGVQRAAYTDKEKTTYSGMLSDAVQRVETKAFPRHTYRSTLRDAEAAYLTPGDTVQISHTLLGAPTKLRCLEVMRVSDGSQATVLWGDRILTTDAGSQAQDVRRRVDQLLRAF